MAEFLRPRSGTPSDYCHPCRADKRRVEYARAGGSVASYGQTLRRYGLTLDGYQARFDAQDGRCAACRRPETTAGKGGKLRRLAVDFDDESSQVRGLLCARCLLLVGVLADGERRRLAEAYLQGHEEAHHGG